MAEPGGRPVLIFDSGVGGLSVLAAVRARMSGRRLVYVADDAGFPYGDWEEGALAEHVVALVGGLVDAHRPAAAVIACNTASTLVLPPLRARHSIPFVGTVPAIKPAAERTRSGVVAVLATPGTMKRDYTRGLIRSFAGHCHVRLVGAPDLARLAEAHLRGEPVPEAEVAAQIAPCFVAVDGRRTDVVVLACTHYPFLRGMFERLAPWPVEWLDPAPAIARRLQAVLAEAGGDGEPADGAADAADGAAEAAGKTAEAAAPGLALFTSGRPVPPPLAAVLARHGLAVAEGGLICRRIGEAAQAFQT